MKLIPRRVRAPRRDPTGNPLIPHCQEKPLTRIKVAVPQSDTGRRGEYPKAHERTLVKELGKIPP